MRSNRIYFFWDKDIGKEAIFFRRRKGNECVCDRKEGEAIAIIVFKECPSLVFITIELCVMAEFNNVDIDWW